MKSDCSQKYVYINKIKEMSESVTPESWISNTSKSFPTWITKTFQTYSTNVATGDVKSCDVKTESFKLMPHQKFIRDYMQHKSPYRGLLLYHGLGVGKTCASIAVAEIMRDVSRSVIVMLPASLNMNYKNEIMKCGNEEYRTNQHWKFKKLRKGKTTKELAEKTGLNQQLIEKFKGYWKVLKTNNEPNFHTLTTTQQQQIVKQIDSMISSKYEFIHYNGITRDAYLKMSSKENIFDNKLVIIDEAHLFISTVVNSNDNNTKSILMYQDLINAKNAKFVLLTGTPIINYPNEIAYTLNLLKGMTTIYKIYFNGHFSNEFLLHNHPEIQYYEIKQNAGHNRVELLLTPIGFIKNKKGELVYKGGKETSDEHRVESIVENMKKSGVIISNYSEKKEYFEEKVKLFPTNKDEFDKYFIDYESNSINNQDLFLRRMMGIVSYYESTDTTLYPQNLGVKHEVLPFSEHQFNKYALTRDQEIKKEKKQKNRKNEGLFETSGVYKTFSRILCNFAFPEEIERPFPKKRFSFMTGEIDMKDELINDINVIEEHEKDMKKHTTAKQVYERDISKALKELESRKDEFLTEDKLENYSPKFAKIIKNINKTNGTVLIYSQFRTMEGLGIMGLSLKARGYAEMKISINDNKISIDVDESDYNKPKYAKFSTDKDVSNIILKIFNSELDSLDSDVQKKLALMHSKDEKDGNLYGSLIKVLMITQSGSAGISLKNVRQVHIMEPYWNKSRIDQVIGRANRTCSHVALPQDERNFRVYMYRMRMSEEQSKKSVLIKSQDNSLSTDQSIYNLAERKDKIVSKLLKTIKRGSVDCALHKGLNTDIECLTFPLDVSNFEKAYLSKIEDDHNNVEQQAIAKIKVKPKKVIIKNEEYIWVSDTNELFDFKLYAKSGVLDKVGTLENKKNGWYKITLFINK